MSLQQQTSRSSLPDLEGEFYRDVIARLHATLRPRTYLEIGTDTGETLALAHCPAIAVDPQFRLLNPVLVQKITDRPFLGLFQMESDRFFADHDAKAIFGRAVDMAFLDGMHRCEFLLRDFINVERICRRNSLVILHDCLPVEPAIASRVQGSEPRTEPHRSDWWAGDVWRTALLIKRRRPDLRMSVFDAGPTGLVIITNLDPANRSLDQDYAACVDEMLQWTLADGGLEAFHAEMEVEPTSAISTSDQITARYWL